VDRGGRQHAHHWAAIAQQHLIQRQFAHDLQVGSRARRSRSSIRPSEAGSIWQVGSRVATNPAPPALSPEAGVGAERRWVSWACATTGFFSPLRGTPRATWCSAPGRRAWVAGSPGRRACAPAMASIASPAKGSLQPAFSPLGEAGRVDVPRPARCPLHYNEQGHSVLFPLTASIAAWRCSAKCSIPSTGLKPRRRRSVSFALRKAASTCGACPALVRP